MLAPFVILSLLAPTCAQPCINCIPQNRQYQYVVNVPMVPVQGVAVPSNSPQPCCNGAAPNQQATQVIWFSQGNGQQNSGMVSNFTAISTQGQYNYQNPTGGTTPPQYINSGNYIAPGPSPVPNQGQTAFTSPPPNYNPDVYLQGSSTPSPNFGQTGAPFAGNQPYSPGYTQESGQGFSQQPENQGFDQSGQGFNQQGGNQEFTQQGAAFNQPSGGFTQQPGNQDQGSYNSANQLFLGNQGSFTTGPVSAQGGPNPTPNDQYYDPEQGFNEQYNPDYPQRQGVFNQPQYNPQGNQQVGNNGMVVTNYQQGQVSGSQGAAITGGTAAGVGAAAAAGFPYSTSTQYSTTTPAPLRTNTPGSTSPGGFQYSTQNPNQPGFVPVQNEQGGFFSTAYPSTSYLGSSSQGYATQGGFSSTMDPNQVVYGPSSQNPNQQGFSATANPNMYPSTGSYGPTTQAPFSPQNEGQFSTQNQFNQGGYVPSSTSGPQQFSPSFTAGPYSPSSSSQFGPSTAPNSQQYPSTTTPFNYVYPGAQGSSQGSNFGSSTMQPTGVYPSGAQQDQGQSTRPPNVNVAGIGGGQATSTYAPVGSSSSSGSSTVFGQDSRGTFVGPTATTARPFYDSNNYNSAYGPTTLGGMQQQGQFSTVSGALTGGGASGGAGYTPQYDFERNMNTQYGRYNSTSATGDSRQNDAPVPQTTAPLNSAEGLHLALLVALSLLLF